MVMHSHNCTLKQLYGRRFVEGEADVVIHGGGHRAWRAAARGAAEAVRDAGWCLAHDVCDSSRGQAGVLARHESNRRQGT